MMRVPRLLRDYRDAGAVNGLLALWGFVDEDDVPHEEPATSASSIAVRGVDAEGLTHAQRKTLTHRVRGRTALARRALSRLPVPDQAGRRRRSHRPRCSQPVAKEAMASVGRHT